MNQSLVKESSQSESRGLSSSERDTLILLFDPAVDDERKIGLSFSLGEGAAKLHLRTERNEKGHPLIKVTGVDSGHDFNPLMVGVYLFFAHLISDRVPEKIMGRPSRLRKYLRNLYTLYGDTTRPHLSPVATPPTKPETHKRMPLPVKAPTAPVKKAAVLQKASRINRSEYAEFGESSNLSMPGKHQLLARGENGYAYVRSDGSIVTLDGADEGNTLYGLTIGCKISVRELSNRNPASVFDAEPRRGLEIGKFYKYLCQFHPEVPIERPKLPWEK
ncbi:MAG: hypothetical protein JWN37_772 [Candidatus Nomurabacteria bacterium]|nr:hypothetical protein [Candidatus Nomurabacteria bacterium]